MESVDARFGEEDPGTRAFGMGWIVNSEQLRYFELAYQERNFSAAARRVPVSPQGLAKAIHALEKELDVTLFEVDELTGLPVPTEYAEELTEFAAVYEANMRLLRESFDRIRGKRKALIRLGCSLGIMGVLGPRFIDGFRSMHPHVEIQYLEAHDRQVDTDLRNGACDLALVVGPYQKGVTVRELYRCPVYYWVRSDDPLAAKERLTIDDFEGRSVAIPGSGFKCYDALTQLASDNGVSLGTVFQMSEIFQLYEFAASGQGLGFTVRHLIDLPIFVRDASVVAIPVDGMAWSFGIERLDAHALGDAEQAFWNWCEQAARTLPDF